MRINALPFFSAALLAFACQSDNGGQSGDFSGENGEEGPNTGGDACKDVETPIDPGDASALGFSASDVTALLEQGFATPLTWQSAGGVSYSPGSGDTELGIDMTPTGEVWYVTSEPNLSEGNATIDIGVHDRPPPRLRIGVDVTLNTTDGALAESFSAKVDAASATLAGLTHDFELEALAGSFAVESVPEGGEVLGLGLAATFTAAGMTGSLSSLLQITYPADDPLSGAVSAQPLVFAAWPNSASCPADQGGISGIPVGVEEDALGLSGQAALERYNAATPVEVRWLDGSESELTLTATAAGDGCVRPNPYVYSSEDPEATVVYPVTLHAVSDDDTLDGTYDAVLTITPDSASDDHRVVIEVHLPLELEQLADAGIDGVTLPGGLHRLFYTLSSEVEAGNAHGLFRLVGHTDPPCLTDPPEPEPGAMGAPGCEGTQVTELRAPPGSGSVD